MEASASGDDTSDLNGLIFNSVYLPEEIVTYILSFLDPDCLVFQCRLVCKNWKFIVDEKVWKVMIRYADHLCSFSKLSRAEKFALNFPWYIYHCIFAKDPFERNLIRNHCGQDKFKFWTRKNRGTGRTFSIESRPIGSDPLPENDDFQGFKSCFASSYLRCEKSQLIHLKKFGILDTIMDVYQPTISASEWYAGRFDCGSVYELTVSLLSENKKVLCQQGGENIMVDDMIWKNVEYKFSHYGPGVRYIKFEHAGKDRRFWAGNYGSKMSGAVVKLSFPEPKNFDCGDSV